MKNKAEIKTVSLSKLNPAEYNPRKISDKAFKGLGESIDRFGLVQPIIWNKKTGNIVGGHQRFAYLKSQGVSETEVVVVDLTVDKEKLLNISLNNEKIEGEWTPNVMELLDAIESGQPELFEALNFDDLYESLKKKNKVEEENNGRKTVGEGSESIIEEGELWILGPHRLLRGSSTSKEDVKKLFDGKKASAIVTDPPYGVDYASKNEELGGGSETIIANDNLDDYRLFFGDFLRLAPLHDENSFFIFMSDRQMENLEISLKDKGFTLSSWLIWMKDSPVLSRMDYNLKHEYVAYGWKGQSCFVGSRGESVLTYKRPRKSDLHPTMKPVEMVEDLIRMACPENSIVYEPFGGSGTTLVASETCRRACYLIELEGKYCERILERWCGQTGLDPIRADDKMKWSDLKKVANE